MNELEARNVCTRIQLRVINLIKSWLQTYPDDFKDDNEMIRKIKDFLKSANERPELKVLIHQVTSKALSVLETIVDKFIFDMQQQAFHRTPQAEMALSTPEWNLSKFLDTSPEEIAKHFDAVDWQNFLQVKPWEFLTITNLSEQRAPHMFKYKNLSKLRSDWITTIIVLEKDIETRKKILGLFIEVAVICLDHFNHFSAMSILAALTDEAVDRLRDTWKLLPATTSKRFDELKKGITNAKTNLERFVACVPSVDVAELRMKEIESLDQAIPGNLVHMKKMTALADMVRLLFKFQESNPKYRVSKSFEEWLENNLVLDAKTRLEKSIELQSNSAHPEPSSSNVQAPAGSLSPEKARLRSNNPSNRSTTVFTSAALNEANIPLTPGIGSARVTIHAEPTGLRTALDSMAEENNTSANQKPAEPKDTKPSEPVSLRTNVTRELLHTERTYVESLELLLKVAVPMLRTRAIIPEDKIKVLIANAEVILNFHKTFVHEMEKMASTPPFKVGDVFLKYYQYFSMYVEYVNNYNKSSELLDKLRKKNKAWAQFEEEMQNSAEFRMEDFDSLLIKPIQRLTKYGLLLNEIKKHTEKSHPDYESVQIAWQKMTMMADHANQAKREAEQLARAVEIENLLTDYNGPQITQDRKYCGETKCYILSTREIIEAAIIFWSDSVMFVKPHSITIGALTLSSQLQFLGLFNTIALTIKKLSKQEVNKKMPNLEMAKMPDDLDVQALSHYASIQTGTEEIIAAFPEKQEHQNFFDSFATVRKAIQERTWKPVEIQPNTPTPRQYHTAVAVGKKIYIFGGNDRKSNYFNELYSFDTETRVWEKKVPNQRGCKPPVLSRHTAAAHGKKIYFFGGQNLENPFLNDTYSVDVETLSWQRLNTTGNIPSIRVSHTSSVVGNKMYVIGGYFFKSITHQNAYNDVFCLDLATNVWTMIEPTGAVPPARFGHWAVVLDKKIYIFGGKTVDHKAMNDMFVFDTETNTWTQQITAVGFVPIARSEASAALLPGTKTIVMSGGISINTLAFQDVFYFNTETCEWQVAWFDVPLEPVHAHTLSIIDDTMYVFGGRLIRPDDFELPLLNDLIPIPGLSSMTTNVNDYQRKKSAVYQKGIFGDLSKMKLYCTQLPPRDETKQLPNESFNIIQKQVTFNWDDNVDALEFEERLEDSGFGEVWKASYKKGDSAETSVAVQVLQGAYSREKYLSLKQAMETINKCRHQNLFSYFGTSSVNNDVWILQEICSGVHLKDLMRITGKPFTELQIATVCAEILKAMAYLHGRHLAHKHLRASTILLTDTCQLKLTDYNLCDQLYTMTGLVDHDAAAWSAPEVGEKGCSDKSDIWSLGITVVELLENVLPASIVCRQFLKNTKVSQEIRDFVSKCMSKVPEKRPDAVELLKHPFIKQARNMDTLRPLVDISKKKRVNMKPVPKGSSHARLPTAGSRSMFSISDGAPPPGHSGLASSNPIPAATEEKIRREYEEKLAQQQTLIQQLLKKQEELEQQLRDAQNTIKQLQQPNGEK
jgi:serine/threonine protein kinase/N-acetylneuraminic acid mutarotase